VDLVALLHALDVRSRNDCGWYYVQDRSAGGIVCEFSALMTTAAACVLLCMFNTGQCGSPGSAERLAFATVLQMRSNLQGGDDDTELYRDMASRLDALDKAVEAGEMPSSDGKVGIKLTKVARTAHLNCTVAELTAAHKQFMATYGEDVADYEEYDEDDDDVDEDD
jgi:hypothetical protein